MKTIIAFLFIALSGCTILPTQHGHAVFGGDYTRISFSDGSVKFSADSANHSRAARVHWNGAANIGAEAVTAFAGGSVIGPAAAVVPSLVNRPTTRASQ